LLDQCYEAELAYHRSVAEMSSKTGVEFDLAVQNTEEASRLRLKCEKALVRHEQMHGCWKQSALAQAG